MKRNLITLSLCLISIIVSAQSKHFNSICIMSGNDSINVFQDIQIDSITFSEEKGMYYQNIWMDNTVKKFQISTIDSVSLFNLYDNQISSIESDNLIWDNYYTTSIGTFAYKSSLNYEEDFDQQEKFEVLSYIDADWINSAFVIFDKEHELPVRFMTDNLTLYITYSNDSIFSLCIDDDNSIESLGEFEYNINSIDEGLKEGAYTSKFKILLFKLLSITNKEALLQTKFQKLLDNFSSLLSAKECSKPQASLNPRDYIILVNVYNSGEEKGKKGKGNILYSAVINTNRHFNVTSNSCIAEGSVCCGYSKFNKDCSYGILFDENPEALFIGKAKFEIPGYQERFASRFTVNVSGLKPGTKYYYKAYLKINNYSNSPLTIKYDNGSRDENGYNVKRPTQTYGTTKSFTTNPPDISGTWTCTETHYKFNNINMPYEVTYSLTLNKDGSVTHSGYDNIPLSSWSFSASGKVNISIMTIATQTLNSGTDWQGTVNDVQNPTKITGTTSSWNVNQIGWYGGDGYSFVMTR